MKHEENGTWRLAGLELFGERMGKKILLCTLFICFQGIMDYRMEAVGGGGVVSAGHKIGREDLVGEEEYSTALHQLEGSTVRTVPEKRCSHVFGRVANTNLTRWAAPASRLVRLSFWHTIADTVCSMDGRVSEYVDVRPRRSLVHVLYSHYHLLFLLFDRCGREGARLVGLDSTHTYLFKIRQLRGTH